MKADGGWRLAADGIQLVAGRLVGGSWWLPSLTI
jgi:hypothetical protein